MRIHNFHQIRTAPILLAIAALLAAQANPPLLENDQVRVINALEKPHVKGRPHKHDVNRVMIYLQAGTQEFTEDGKKSILKYKAGTVLWSPKTGMHEPELLTEQPVTIVEVLLKQPGGGKTITSAMDPLKVAPKQYKLEFENDQVRVLRAKFPPHQGAAMHEHQLNRVGVFLTDQNIKITNADGSVVTAVHKRGEVSWAEGAAKHKEENLNNTPFEAILVELK